MLRNKINPNLVAIVLVVIMAAALRILSNGMIPNFTPIGALALFGGAYLQDKRLAFVLPITAMLISDLFLGFHETMIYVYASFFLIVALSRMVNFNKVSLGRTFGSTLIASVLFFMITNFGVWASTGMYEMSFAGLMSSYVAGLPFLKYSVLGDVFFVTVFFGTFELVRRFVLPTYKVA